ncbi:MAG TPA: hypothetical protein VI757_10790 [Bacteroidia bacterium]|nr:hypothetical protein [Bacteroidia bacterium]
MKIQHISIDFSGIKDAGLSEFTQGVEDGFTNNPGIFPDLPVDVPIVKAQREDYELKLVKSLNGNTADTAAKDAARLVLEASLKSDGQYADIVTGNNVANKLLSGYHLTDIPSPVGELPAPNYVKVTDGNNAGEFDVDIAVVKKASGYLVAFTPESNTEPNPYNWTLRWTKKHTNTFTGYTSGTKYKIAAAAVGASSIVNFSNPVTRIAQ